MSQAGSRQPTTIVSRIPYPIFQVIRCYTIHAKITLTLLNFVVNAVYIAYSDYFNSKHYEKLPRIAQ